MINSKMQNDEETWWPHGLGRPRISDPAHPGTWDQDQVRDDHHHHHYQNQNHLSPSRISGPAHLGTWQCKQFEVGLSTCVMTLKSLKLN